MPSARNVLLPAGRHVLRPVVAGCAVAVSALLPGAVATADEPAGRSVTGELIQAWAEAAPGEDVHGHHDGRVSWVQPADGDPVLVDAAGVEGVPSGSTVSLTVATDVPAGSVDEALPVLDAQVLSSQQAAPARATNEVTVVMVAPAGSDPAGDGTTLEQVVSAVEDRVAPFWAEQSGGAIALGVTQAHGWTAAGVTCEQPGLLWDDVAARVHFEPGPGRHLLLYVSRGAGCGYALAEVGTSPSSGGRLYVTDTSTSAMAHEFGHNFGLGHSSAEQCDAVIEGGSCRTVAYRDHYDVMGVSWAQLGTLNAAQAARLGLLAAAEQQAVTVTGSATTATLSPLSGRSGTRALRLTDAEGVDYWLEYRTPSGRDAWLASANRYGLDSGVLLRRAGGLPDTSLLLDGTPTGVGGWDGDHRAALPVGTAVPVSGGDFSVVVRSTSTDGAVVTVTPTPPTAARTPVPSAPTTPRGTVMAGTDGTTAAEVPVVSEGMTASLQAPEYGSAVHRSDAGGRTAADTSGVTGYLLAGAGALLAGLTLLTAQRLRRRAAR